MPAETHVEQGPLDRNGVFELIRDRLADILEIDPSTIKEGDSFVDDLDADSLALIELVEALEEELGERTVGFHIDDEDLADLKTVRDAVDYVVGRLGGLTVELLPVTGLAALNERLGRPVADETALAAALAHRSWCAENPGHDSNERLEFLGDAVLGLVVTDHIYRTLPDAPRGRAGQGAGVGGERGGAGRGGGRARARRRPACSARARPGRAGARSRRSSPTRSRRSSARCTSTAAGTAAERLVLDLLGDRISEASEGPGGQDYKTRLQELVARHFTELPRYGVRDEGPDHAKRFFAEVRVGGHVRGQGEGRSKKQAEAAAARSAWETLRDELDAGEARPSRPTGTVETNADA